MLSLRLLELSTLAVQRARVDSRRRVEEVGVGGKRRREEDVGVRSSRGGLSTTARWVSRNDRGDVE